MNAQWNQLPAIESFLSGIDLEKFDNVLLNDGQKFNNLKHTVTGHLQMCKSNKGNDTFLPYLERLIMLKNILERRKDK